MINPIIKLLPVLFIVIRQYGLLRRDFRMKPLEYRLVRARDGRPLHPGKNLYHLGISNHEVLRLVCPKARRVWVRIQKTLDKIESQIYDQVSGKVKEEVTRRAWRSVECKLKKLEKTRAGDPRLVVARRWVGTVNYYGGPGWFLGWADVILELLSATGIGASLVRIMLAAGLSLIALGVASAASGRA